MICESHQGASQNREATGTAMIGHRAMAGFVCVDLLMETVAKIAKLACQADFLVPVLIRIDYRDVKTGRLHHPFLWFTDAKCTRNMKHLIRLNVMQGASLKQEEAEYAAIRGAQFGEVALEDGRSMPSEKELVVADMIRCELYKLQYYWHQIPSEARAHMALFVVQQAPGFHGYHYLCEIASTSSEFDLSRILASRIPVSKYYRTLPIASSVPD